MLTTPYARSLAHARGGSQVEEKNLLLPPFTLRPYYLGYRDYIILFGIYMSFSRFQYELLVHTPNTDVYRRILECRFTHFAPYVVHIETDVIVRTLPRPSTLAHVVDVQYHYCSTSRRGEEPIARLIFWRCQAQGYRRTSSRCRVIYK